MGLLRLTTSPGARTFYDHHRAAGDLHHQALRALGNRLVGASCTAASATTPPTTNTQPGHTAKPTPTPTQLDNLRPWDV